MKFTNRIIQVAPERGHTNKNEFLRCIRSVLVTCKILGVFPVKNVIFGRGRPLRSSFPSRENFWSLVLATAAFYCTYTSERIRKKLEVSAWTDVLVGLAYPLVISITATLCMCMMTQASSGTCRILTKLEQIFEYLPVRDDVRRTGRGIFASIVIAAVVYIIQFMSRGLEGNLSKTLYFVGLVTFEMMCFANLAFVTLLAQITAVMLKKVNESIAQVAGKLPSKSVSVEDMSRIRVPTLVSVQELERCALLHSWLTQEVQSISQEYGMILLVHYGTMFLTMVTMLYRVIVDVINKKMRSGTPTRLIVMTFRFILDTYLFGNIPHHANSAMSDLENVSLSQLSLDCREEVKVLQHRLSHEPPVITAGSFFSINRSLLTSVAGTITTYLVILVQFKMSADDSAAGVTSLDRHFSNSTL